MGNVYKDRLPDVWHSAIHKQLQVLALTERCPGCLAACSDVEAFNDVALAPAAGAPSEVLPTGAT